MYNFALQFSFSCVWISCNNYICFFSFSSVNWHYLRTMPGEFHKERWTQRLQCVKVKHCEECYFVLSIRNNNLHLLSTYSPIRCEKILRWNKLNFFFLFSKRNFEAEYLLSVFFFDFFVLLISLQSWLK